MISVAELKVALRIRNDAEDAYIKTLEAGAIALLERETGQYYGSPKDVTEIVTAGEVVWLLSTPSEIAEVSTYDGVAWQAVTGYESLGRRVTLGTEAWPYGSRVRIDYTTGYEDGDVPADIRIKVMQIVAFCFEKRLPEATDMEELRAIIGPNPTI